MTHRELVADAENELVNCESGCSIETQRKLIDALEALTPQGEAGEIVAFLHGLVGGSFTPHENDQIFAAATLILSLQAQLAARDAVVSVADEIICKRGPYCDCRDPEDAKANCHNYCGTSPAPAGGLVEAATKARDKFLHYEDLHRLKCTPEGDEKADRNREMADMLTEALTALQGDKDECARLELAKRLHWLEERFAPGVEETSWDRLSGSERQFYLSIIGDLARFCDLWSAIIPTLQGDADGGLIDFLQEFQKRGRSAGHTLEQAQELIDRVPDILSNLQGFADGGRHTAPTAGDVVEQIARALAELHGQDPDEYAPLSEICGPNNTQLFWWQFYEEDAIIASQALATAPERDGVSELLAAIEALPVSDMIEPDPRDGSPTLLGYCMQAQGEWDRVVRAARALRTTQGDKA